jgi:hypothetical protein
MPRYYFDIRDGASLCEDVEGRDLADVKAAEVETAETLVEIAREVAPFEENQQIAIEVRTDEGLLFKAILSIEVTAKAIAETRRG